MPFPTRSGPSVSDQIIDALTAQYRSLLKENFIELWALTNKGDAKGNVGFVVSPNGKEKHFTLASTFTFGCRMRHRLKEEHTCI